MFKLTPQNFSLVLFILSLCIFMNVQASYFQSGIEAKVEEFIDTQHLRATSSSAEWFTQEKLAIISSQTDLGIIAFAEIEDVKRLSDDKFELSLKLLRQSRKHLILKGDQLKRLDLSRPNSEYIGATELLIQDSKMNISSKYRPLVHQGFVIGDTAQTLAEKEFLMNYFGNLYYGYNEWLTLGSLVPINAFGRPNANFRARVYNSDSTTISAGLSFVRLTQEDEASLNLNFYWDSISSDALISHTFLSFGLVNYKNSGDAAAIKYLTSSSFQTGYEVILDNWNRFLIGPSYNFEKKALGGYLSYIWILDRTHVQLSLNATDVTHLRLDPTDGYYGFFDIFWRF